MLVAQPLSAQNFGAWASHADSAWIDVLAAL